MGSAGKGYFRMVMPLLPGFGLPMPHSDEIPIGDENETAITWCPDCGRGHPEGECPNIPDRLPIDDDAVRIVDWDAVEGRE